MVLSRELDAQNRLGLVLSYELMQALADFTATVTRQQMRRLLTPYQAQGSQLAIN